MAEIDLSLLNGHKTNLASVFATASSANQNNQIEVMASGPNGGQRVAAVITVNVV